jgi:hypothetical protein
VIEIAFCERERLLYAQPRSPHDHDQSAQPAAVRAVAGGAHDGGDLFDLGRVGGVAQALVCRRVSCVEAGHRRR